MKKASIAILVVIMLLCIVLCSTKIYAASSSAIDSKTESQLIELKENQAKTIEDIN